MERTILTASESTINHINNVISQPTVIKRADHKMTDLGQILKDHPLRVFVKRTTMRPVSPIAGSFDFHSIKTPAPAYFFRIGFDVNFADKYQDLQDNITMIKARIEYEKLNEEAKMRRKGFRIGNA